MLLARERSRAARLAARAIHALARPIERLHTGYVGDAVAWIGVGAALLFTWIAWRAHMAW